MKKTNTHNGRPPHLRRRSWPRVPEKRIIHIVLVDLTPIIVVAILRILAPLHADSLSLLRGGDGGVIVRRDRSLKRLLSFRPELRARRRYLRIDGIRRLFGFLRRLLPVILGRFFLLPILVLAALVAIAFRLAAFFRFLGLRGSRRRSCRRCSCRLLGQSRSDDCTQSVPLRTSRIFS